MPEIELICPSCGQAFKANETAQRVFCVSCGTMIDRSASALGEQPATSTGQAAAPEADESAARLADARAAFELARFMIVDKKSGLKGDRLIGLWTNLMFHGQNSKSQWAIRSAQKEIGSYFEEKIWQDAFNKAGDQRKRLIIEQLLDSAVSYLSTCRDDSRYGSRLLGVMRMNAADIARKAAMDMSSLVIRYLLKIGQPGESAAIIHAVVVAYPRVFPSYSQVFVDQLAETLEPEDYALVLRQVEAIARLA